MPRSRCGSSACATVRTAPAPRRCWPWRRSIGEAEAGAVPFVSDDAARSSRRVRAPRRRLRSRTRSSPDRVLAVEQPFSIAVPHHPSTGEVFGFEEQISGVWDSVVEEADGCVAVIDHKVGKRAPVIEQGFDLQLLVYALAAEEAFKPRRPVRIYHHAIVRTKTPKVELREVPRMPHDLDEAIESVTSGLTLVHAAVAHPQPARLLAEGAAGGATTAPTVDVARRRGHEAADHAHATHAQPIFQLDGQLYIDPYSTTATPSRWTSKSCATSSRRHHRRRSCWRGCSRRARRAGRRSSYARARWKFTRTCYSRALGGRCRSSECQCSAASRSRTILARSRSSAVTAQRLMRERSAAGDWSSNVNSSWAGTSRPRAELLDRVQRRRLAFDLDRLDEFCVELGALTERLQRHAFAASQIAEPPPESGTEGELSTSERP